MTLTLESNHRDRIPLEVEGILPEHTRGKSLAQIERLPIYYGNRSVLLGDCFHVSGQSSSNQITWSGDLTNVHRIGAGMRSGTMRVAGAAGRHLGSCMRGGRIDVEQDVQDWLGAEMAGGVIHVHGNAGNLAGGAYHGSPRGMTGGTLLIDGDAGDELGNSMRRGFIAVRGAAGDMAGFNMLAGSIFVFGPCGLRPGAGMRRGTIAIVGSSNFQPLPTFRHAFRGQLNILRLIERSLRDHQFRLPFSLGVLDVDLFNGDLLEGGRGELLRTAS